MKKPLVITSALTVVLGLGTAVFASLHGSRVVDSHFAIIEFAKVPSVEMVSALREKVPQASAIVRFDNFESDYFRRAYEVTFSGEFVELEKAVLKSGAEIKRVELVQTAELSSIVPSGMKTNSVAGDPLVNYQWALSSNGQKILREIDDIHSETIIADPKGPKIDIGLGNSRARMKAEAKRDMIVAVVDSGVDSSHPELAKSLALNLSECDAGKIPFRPKDDNDGNGYKGDCIGWNFAEEGDGSNNTDDDDPEGHGTHVSGIIAAEIGNNVGVAGVAPRIKILPIKVLGNKDTGRAMTSRAAKAILYAVKMKADVVNFSMGWPNSVDTEFLRQSFAEARKAGVTIVAAAGNNTSAAPVFPCSYEGVICVGAATISGEIANFSNYGGHVDVVAPGEEILSLSPTGREPDHFSVRGYDIKNGTSQAAPFVSAQAAILRALIPNITPDEIQARMISTTKAVKWADKFGLDGLTDITASLNAKPQPVVRPDFKRLYQVGFTMDDRAFQFDLPVKNFWLGASNVRVDIASDSANLSIDTPSQAVGALATGETKVLHVSGRIQSTDARRESRLLVKITVDGKSATYAQQIVLTRELDNDRAVSTYPITLSTNVANLQMLTVSSTRADEAYPDYFTIDKSDNTALAVNLIRFKNGAYVQEPTLRFEGAANMVFIYRVDVNYDGVSDYVIETVGQANNKNWIQLSYLNQNLQPIFGRQRDIRIEAEGRIIEDKPNEGIMESLRWTSAQTPFGRIAMPLFRARGGLPKADLNPDPFAFEQNVGIPRLYYYEPKLTNGVYTLATRSYDNTKFMDQTRATLGLRFRKSIDLSALLPQTPKDFADGRIRMLLDIGQSTMKTYRMISVQGVSQLDSKGFKLEPTNYQGQMFEGAADNVNAMNLSNVHPISRDSVIFSSFYSGKLGRVTLLDGASSTKIAGTQQISPERPQDSLLGFVGAYQLGSDLVAFYQTKSRVLMRRSGRQSVQLSDQLDRTSLVDADTFKKLVFSQIAVGGANKPKSPALYEDATLIFANRVFSYTYENGALTAPMKLNVDIPTGCKPLAPGRFGTGGEFAYIFMCTTKASDNSQTYSLKTLTVE